MSRRLRYLIKMSVLISGIATSTQGIAQQIKNTKGPEADVVLGVLEDVPGESDFRVVRAVFKKTSGEWQAFPTKTESYLDLQTLRASYPKEMKWTVAFDGRNLGLMTSQTPSHFNSYSEIGIEHITSQGPVPTVGGKSAEYASFLGTPVYRPLVAVSRPNFRDPDQWKPAHLSTARIAAARQQFRSKFPSITNCRNPNENIPRPWRYGDKDLEASKAYSSKNGWSQLELTLKGYACDDPEEQLEAFQSQWYIFEPSGQIRLLGTEMWLIDAGDYDNSGQSALLFSVNGYNTGGYRLYYRNFTRTAEFAFHYH